MESDLRYQWLEKIIVSCLNAKKEALLNLVENEDNKLVILEFLNNEDIKQLYIYSKSANNIYASRNCSVDGDYEKGIYFLKISNSSKLTPDQMSNQVAYFESSIRIFDHMDLITREVFMPLLCADNGGLSIVSNDQHHQHQQQLQSTDQADKLMDVMHRIIAQLAVAQSQVEDSVTLPLPSLSLLATAAINPNRRLTVLHILETTLINWQRQIKNALKQQPEIENIKSNFYTKDEIQLWTSCINKLNNLIVQLDAQHVKDILMNLENNNSSYVQPFNSIKNDIKSAIKSAEINLRYISTLTPWVHKIKTSNLVEEAQYLFTGLFHTLLLIWQHSKYYHLKDRFAHMLLFLSNEIVSVSKQVVGDKILEDPLRSYNKLKEALRICAMFRGTYLDFKEKADGLNAKFHKLEKRIDFNEKQLWWVQLYSSDDHVKLDDSNGNNDEFEVMRQNSPWPKRNHNCFFNLNVFMERCNDVLELVQTMRHFQILSKTVSIGGSDNQNMDILAQEIHMKYEKAISEFQFNVSDVMSFDFSVNKNFEISFFHLRTTIKELERELSQILNLSIKHCTTIGSKLRLLQVFEGVHERDVIQERLNMEYSWLINELIKEFSNVRQLCSNAKHTPSIMPSIATKLFWYYGLEQRIKNPMDKFSYLYPNLLQGDVGYHLRDSYKQTIDLIEKCRKDALDSWQSRISSSLTDKLQQTIFKNVSIEDMISKRPSLIEVNLDFELEKILKEIRYLRTTPLNIDLTNILKDKFNNIKDEKQLILYATRARLIADKYNLIMKNIQPEEIPLFEIKLNRIDSIIELGLNEYTWNSVEIPDYIEKAHSIICTDVYQNLELIHQNSQEIYAIVNSWCDKESDVFKNRDFNLTRTAKDLEKHQAEFDESIRKDIIRGGNKIHLLIASNLGAVETSEASPGWQEYINFTNEVIYNGFKISTIQSLRNMHNAMTEPEELKMPFVCINLELIDNKLLFSPPLDENSHLKNLQEILFDFINTFISRGSYMSVLGKNRSNYDQMVANDDSTFDLVNKINDSIEKTSTSCRKVFDYFNSFSYLWTGDIHITFSEFLKGITSLSRGKQKRPPSKNFMSNRNAAKSIASLGSMLTPEAISNIERTFLSPYYQSMPKAEKELGLTPLLEDFDAEIGVYVGAREQILNLKNYQDVSWIRINLQPTIDILITLTNKLVWKFTSFLSNQIKVTLNELDQFLKKMEPDIEKITGEERDTETFMKIMRIFNEVSSKQQEMEIKFELMKKTIDLLKKYNRFDVYDLEVKFNQTPVRWSNLKSKVTLAKQRLGPTIQEESKLIIKDLKQFSIVIDDLYSDIMESYLFRIDCDSEQAAELLIQFSDRFQSLQNKADDLKQLQELLESDIVDFEKLVRSKKILFFLEQTWKAIGDIRSKHNEWKSIRWQKVNIKLANEETDKQLEQLKNLASDIHGWDIYLNIKEEILNIKNCLPIIEEIANPAMRTRHWKNLVRISGGTALVDNETLKMLTFGQLLDLNLHMHIEEVKQIVQKAIKDLSIEQTIKTYEEIWLSKIFDLKKYGTTHSEQTSKPISNDDDDKSSHDRRSSFSRIGVVQASSTTKSNKRLSIGSLPNSLLGLEPLGENEPIYLFENAEFLFAELDHHQIVLQELLMNQSAGSFYDEIIKWQQTLQNIEAVLKVWNSVQNKWKRIESAYAMYEIQTILPQESASFFKTDRDFKVLMKATHKNSNILKCCQRKNILNILKHLNQNLEACYESLLQEMSKRRQKCPRLYLLNDEDLIELLCCGSNLENLSRNINKSFSHIKSLRFEINTLTNETSVIGCYDRNMEYLPFKTPIVYSGNVEDFINDFELRLKDSIKYLLDLSLNGSLPPLPPPLTQMNNSQSLNASQKLQVNKTQGLPSIKESNEADQSAAVQFSWIFQHCTQVIELSLRILFTNQIESCLNESKLEELKKLEAKFGVLIEFYMKEMNNYELKLSKDLADENSSSSSEKSKSGIIMNQDQHQKLQLIIKLIIYYRNKCKSLINENQASAQSPLWLNTLRYYYKKINDKENTVIIKSSTNNNEINYGFQYYSRPQDHDTSVIYESTQVEDTINYLVSIMYHKSNPLLYGMHSKKVIDMFGQLFGYEPNYLLCSEDTSNDSLNNICKALCVSGYWITFLNLNNLNSKLMSSLSNVLTQLNDRKENIQINNDTFKLFKPAQQNDLFGYFAICDHSYDKLMTNSKIDSLRITKIDNCLNKISKDLLEKFQAVKISLKQIPTKAYFISNLIVNGFKSNEQLSTKLMKLNDVYKTILRVLTKNSDIDFIDSSLANCYIKEAGKLLYERNYFGSNITSGDLIENNSLAACYSNTIFPRLDRKSSIMLMNCLKMIWPDIKLPSLHQMSIENNVKILNSPIYMEKETAMQIDDKLNIASYVDATCISTHRLNLSPSILFQSKAISLIDTLLNSSNKNVLLVGQSGSGKTALIKTALNALQELGHLIDKCHIYINSFTNNDLFGLGESSKSNSLNREGLITSQLKNFDKNSKLNFIHFIGESSPQNFYFYESLFNNEPIFLNQNNEKRQNDLEKLKLIWETDDLSNLSPTLISNSNLIYLSSSLTIWQHSIESLFQSGSFNNQSNDLLYKKLKDELLNKLKLVKDEFDSKPYDYKDVLSVKFESKVRLCLSILRSLIKNNDYWSVKNVVPLVEYCVLTGCSAALTLQSRDLFDQWAKSVMTTLPKEKQIYDYYYDIDSNQFLLWSDNIPTFSCPVHQGIPLNIFVHTPSSMLINSMLDVMMNLDESFLIAGETGCGKTALISDKLKTSCSGDLTELFSITINSNRLTTSNYLHTRINHNLTWIHGSKYVPRGNKRMYCFIDDIHQSYIDETDRQSAVEFLRQHLDSEKMYDVGTKKWQHVKNVTYITTFNYKIYSPSSSKSNKILKHFHVVAQHFPSNSETHGIYTKLLYRHFIGDIENESSNSKLNLTVNSRLKNLQTVIKNIIQTSIDLNQKMRALFLEKSERLHYVFTLRILTSLFRHICLSLSPDCSKEQLLLLWHHECDWLYGQRMIDNVDVERYKLAYKTVVKQNFNDTNDLDILNRNTYFSNLKETESGIVLAGLAANGYPNSANSNNSGNGDGSNSNTSSSNSGNSNSDSTNSSGSSSGSSSSGSSSSGSNTITDNYESTNDLKNIRKLVKIALNEYNKEQQRIVLPLYESTLNLITRLSHTTQCIGGNCCIVADGGISPFVLQLVASLMQYNLFHFKMSQYMYNKDSFFQQLKHKLINSYYKAGIKGEKVMICLTEEEMTNKEFLTYITEFLITEEVMHLFTIEEETTILNSIRTQVVQSGYVYTRETAWEFFVKNIRENTRIVIVLNENSSKFQTLAVEYSSLFNNMELIWIQNWNMKQLVDNAIYHLDDIEWLDVSSKENLAHLLASMHYSVRENDTSRSCHLNNITYTKFVEKFKTLLINKYKEIEFSHKDTCRLLEHIQKEHSIAKKLLVQLQQDCMVLEERIDSTNKMLQQIGQDMTMTEQQLKVHHMQTRKTVQLKRVLPEYQSAHERNVYKTVAIVADTKKLIQNINMNSLQELRSVQKPDSRMEDILAAIIMILKSPTADVTWQKGAKRQMANIDRFMEELQTFDEHEITENTIKLLEDFVKKIDSYEKSPNQKQMPYYDALNTLDEWIRGVLRYHSLMIKYVRPLHKKVEEIEKEVQEADQKLTTLNRKSEALNARLTDLAQNFEEATVDKEEQEEKVIKMKQQLQTASELNSTLSREFDRNMQIYESLQERIFCLPGACALSAGFLIYLGPFDFRFRRLMLTGYWIKCLNDRGLPLVLDSISLIKGRTIKWQMESLSHLLPYANEINVPNGDGWVLNFASDVNPNEPFIGSATTEESVINKNKEGGVGVGDITNRDGPETTRSGEESLNNNKAAVKIVVNQSSPVKSSNSNRNTPIKLTTTANVSSSLDKPANSNNENQTNEQNNVNETNTFFDESMVKMENSNPVSPVSESDDEYDLVNTSNYRQFAIALIQYIIGENECLDWMSNDATGLELENGAIISSTEKYPPIIYDPFGSGSNWIINKITESIIDLDLKNSEDLLAIEKSFQNGLKMFYTNCKEIDSILLPLIYYKNAMNNNMNQGADDSKLVLFSNRRLFCNPTFQMYFETPKEFNTFSPNILTCTTPISYKPSVENFIDQFQNTLFELLFPDEYKKRIILLNIIKECNKKLAQIDEVLKKKWEAEGFREEEILLTKIALQRKYKIGEILEYCQEYLTIINDLMTQLTPLAIRASLLMILSIKMNTISKNYEFSLNLVEFIFISLPSKVNTQKKELKLKNVIDLNEKEEPHDNSQEVSNIEKDLPELPLLNELDKSDLNIFTIEDIQVLIKYLTNAFLNSVITSLLPEHRLYLLTLICFYIKSEEKQDFTDLELEFLIRGKYNSNLNITLADFGLPKSVHKPEWIPSDNWNDLLAMSLLQGELDHFVVAVVSAEKEWKQWYENPFKKPMPKIEMEVEKSNKTEIVELNEFRKLILSKVLRPDAYIQFLNDYVKKSLDLKLNEPDWSFVFDNPLYKSVIINMGSQSNISNTSSMSRIHKNLFEIAKNNKQKITGFNCNFLTLTELRVEIKNVKEGFVLLKNAHLASSDVVDFIKSLCELVNSDKQQDIKWRLILTKSFDYVLPPTVTSQSLQVSFDVIDIIAHNSHEKNRKLVLDTCLIRPETFIFNCIQSSLNLVKNDEISNLVKSLSKEKTILIYIVCLVQGLLQSRQNIACNGLSKSFPWGVSCLKQAFIALNQFISNDFTNLSSFLVNTVYSNFLEDQMDQDYLLNLINILLASKNNKSVKINGVDLPIPDQSIATNDYANWLEESIPDRTIDSRILQLHEQQIIYYNNIRAEDFIEKLQDLWESNTINSIKLSDELQQDWLYYSIKLCNEKLPGFLPKLHDDKYIEFKPDNAVAFAIYREYNLFNENMRLVKNHLKNIEKYLLLNTQLFPSEWKDIALTLQSQRVPDQWEHTNCRPSIHTLKSWIQSQNVRFNQLFEFYKSKFTNIHSVKANILKEPKMFFSCILLEHCAKNNSDISEVELCFEIKSESDKNENGGVLLTDLKLIDGKWDSIKKLIIKSEYMINKLPPVLVYATQRQSKSKQEASNKLNTNNIRVYTNNLRQYHIIDMKPIQFNCSDELIPYIAFDTGIDELQSLRLHKPIITNLISAYQQSTVESMKLNNITNSNTNMIGSKNNITKVNQHEESSSSLSAAYLTVRQSLSRTNNKTLLQIREASAALVKSPESQLSYKPMTQNAPPLPPDLSQTMIRSKPM